MGQERDWIRFRSLLTPHASLTFTGRDQQGDVVYRTMTPEAYWVMNAPNLERIGFRENEIGRTREDFGAVTHVMSAYESLRREETEPFSRGVNSVQLIHDGQRWWILSILWDSERPDNPIPEKYLGGGR